ncbi:hypothetical protein GKZ75_09595 [Kocuria indica]|uniref:Uncharacterized protein n=1 Tax=Kocuria marina subsp. indica TaxID=1049583 RepID=A0A6N9R1M5_9MICC|nr:hypothetical protein [Kocuria indica]NDO78470.1 hypothetical protein [Kocuria indica]
MRYYSKTEAAAHEIVEALGEYAGQHDIDAIADEVLTMRHTENEAGQTVGDPWYEVTVSENEFWDSVGRHAIG